MVVEKAALAAFSKSTPSEIWFISGVSNAQSNQLSADINQFFSRFHVMAMWVW